MGTLYVDRKDIQLQHEAGRIVLREAGAVTGGVPLSHLERIVIWRQARIDTGLLGALAERGIGLVVINARRPARTAILAGRAHNDAERRLAQYRHSLDDAWCAGFAARLITAKLQAQLRLLGRLAGARPDKRYALVRAQRTVRECLGRLAACGGLGVEEIRGLEGAAAAAHFRGLGAVFPPALEFSGRNRRPPRDPVNACLSLTYTLLHSEAVLAAHATGLDPFIGFYHRTAFGRESLASDLIEPLRPLADAWVWELFRTRLLRGDDFGKRDGACLLKKAGRKTYYERYESLARGLRRRLRRYSRVTVRALTGDNAALDSPPRNGTDENTLS